MSSLRNWETRSPVGKQMPWSSRRKRKGDEAAEAAEDWDEGDPHEEEADLVGAPVADVGERDDLECRRHRRRHLLYYSGLDIEVRRAGFFFLVRRGSGPGSESDGSRAPSSFCCSRHRARATPPPPHLPAARTGSPCAKPSSARRTRDRRGQRQNSEPTTELGIDEISPPPSSSPEKLETLVKNDGRAAITVARQCVVAAESREMGVITGGRVRASAVLMQLMRGNGPVNSNKIRVITYFEEK